MTKALTTAALALALAPAAFGQSLATTINNNNFLPAPPLGSLNVHWQQDGARPTLNVSAYVSYPTIQVACPGSGDLSAPVVAALAALNSSNGGIIDARACTAATTWTGTVTLSTPATVILFPCATIEAFNTLTIGAGIRNVALRGCAYQGGSTASGTNGGTVWRFVGSGPAFSVGDPSYAIDTQGFEISNFNINTVNASNTSPAISAYRSQQLYFHALYINGDGQTTQPGLYFDGTGNYTGGVFSDIHIAQEGLALVAVGDETGLGEDDYLNASTFVGVHIDCTTSSGSPVSAVTGLDLTGGDGNTFTGADIEGCGIAVHLGAYATSNTFTGIRSENSIWQYYANAYSSYNVISGGSTIEEGKLYDGGTQNSWQDGFHRDFSQINGDRYASQEDATVTNHYRLGVGAGAERGLQNEIQTDYGNRWQYGFSDGTTGEQFYFLTDLLNSVQRLSIGQYLSATAGTVTNVVVNSGGCYSSSTAPTLSFTGGGGSGAAATANMVTSRCSGGWAIGTVTVTSPGSSYTTNPATGVSGGSQVSAPRLQAEITTAGSTNNQTALSAAGTGAVVINGTANSGTGGLVVDSGGATPTAVASIDSAGDVQMQGNAEWYVSSTLEWEIEAASASDFIIRCPACTVPADILIAYNNGGTEIDSQATSAVVFNNHSFAGTGGLILYEGGTNSSTVAFQVSGSGNAIAIGNVATENHFNQGSANQTAGQCTMSSATSCTVSLAHSFASTPDCGVATVGSTPVLASYTWATNVITVHVGSSTSATFAVTCIGNPN